MIRDDRAVRGSGHELEGLDVRWAHDAEVPAVEGGDGGDVEALGRGDLGDAEDWNHQQPRVILEQLDAVSVP